MIELEPCKLKGKIYIPASKSDSQRALFAACLASQPTVISNFGKSNDELAMLSCCRQLGAEIQQFENQLKITPQKSFPEKIQLNCGESGLATRLLAGTLILSGVDFVLTGEGSLMRRKFNEITDFLDNYNFSYSSSNKSLPLSVNGRELPKIIETDGSAGSQFVSGLLFGMSKNNSIDQLKVSELKSQPYVDMTIETLKKFGVTIDQREMKTFRISSSTDPSNNYNIESDWSSASCWLAAAAIHEAKAIQIAGLKMSSKQADKKMLDVLLLAGCSIFHESDFICVDGHNRKAFNFDASHCPDLFPAIAVLAANCEGESIIKGLNRLANKESDRGLALQQEFAKAGIKIDLLDDYMHIHGTKVYSGANFDSHNDHRIAMACAILSSLANGKSTLNGEDSVRKSYPEFWENYRQLY